MSQVHHNKWFLVICATLTLSFTFHLLNVTPQQRPFPGRDQTIDIASTMTPFARFLRKVESGHVQRFQVVDERSNTLFTPATFYKSLSNNEGFRNGLIELLAEVQADSYFFETVPVTARTMDEQLFEFALVAPAHLTNQADGSPFAEHFGSGTQKSLTVSFFNLSGKSLLIAPTPDPEVHHDAYAHIGAFFRSAPLEQKHALLQDLGNHVFNLLGQSDPDASLWVSTSGAGVAWLHMRLDNFPKYYTYSTYRPPSFRAQPF